MGIGSKLHGVKFGDGMRIAMVEVKWDFCVSTPLAAVALNSLVYLMLFCMYVGEASILTEYQGKNW